MHQILAMLAGGDRRSIGRADEVAALAESDPGLLPLLISGMSNHEPLIRMRCADAADALNARSRARDGVLPPMPRKREPGR